MTAFMTFLFVGPNITIHACHKSRGGGRRRRRRTTRHTTVAGTFRIRHTYFFNVNFLQRNFPVLAFHVQCTRHFKEPVLIAPRSLDCNGGGVVQDFVTEHKVCVWNGVADGNIKSSVKSSGELKRIGCSSNFYNVTVNRFGVREVHGFTIGARGPFPMEFRAGVRRFHCKKKGSLHCCFGYCGIWFKGL